jgi:hypothetical protein
MYVPLIEFMYSIPWNIKLSPSPDRVLQRAAFSDILPPLITQRDTKSGPDQAFYTGLGTGLDWLKLLTERPLISARGYVDNERWIHAVESATLGRCISLKHFVAATSLEFWLQQFETPLIDADNVTKDTRKVVARV